PRPYLPDAGGDPTPRRDPLFLLRPYRPEGVLRLRHDRARHGELLHGDVLLPVGPVCVAGHRAEGSAELSGGPPAPTRPTLRDLRTHGHSARLLRHLAATPPRNRLLGI